ncbi:MAG: hypothetical protein ACI9JY_002144 [Saprospiraceae bacterium]|jgi:hypothetical protein
MEITKSDTKVWDGILNGILAIPGARINRNDFLKNNLSKFCTPEQIKLAIENGTLNAGIDIKILDKVADSAIKLHTITATGASAAAGVPGGFAMIGTIPADLLQYYYHVIIVSQKLAYTYGYPELDGDADDDFLSMLTLFMGVMSGVKAANLALVKLTNDLSKEVVKRLPKIALTKYGIYQVSKQVAKWFGVNLTKGAFARSVSKIIPGVSALISGGITLATFLPMAKRLKKNLRGNIISKDFA